MRPAIRRFLVALFALLVVGCGNDTVNSIAQVIADPTDQLPAHVNWNSYNVYQYSPGTVGVWNKIISLGTPVGNLPTLGAHPVMIAHGLGSSISGGKFSLLAQNLFDNSLATDVLGFEYDTQDGIVNNGAFYKQALGLLSPSGTSPLSWVFISHSMGGLVARSAIQSGSLPIGLGNKLVMLGTPNLGSPVANAVQEESNIVTRTAVLLTLDQGGFNNADGNPCEIDVSSQGFTDLRTDSIFVASLNASNPNNHATVDYFTVAGTDKGIYSAMDDLLGVSTDDGLVTLGSATPTNLGITNSGTAPVDHTALTTDTVTTFPLVRGYLMQ